MSKVFKFKVFIEALENKIEREIEIEKDSTVADLSYTILATFDSLAYHLYNIKYNNKQYDCMIGSEDYYREDYYSDLELVDATVTKLESLNLKNNDLMEMEYDYGSTTTFIIKYLGEVEKREEIVYPYIVKGRGCGMLDDMSSGMLEEIVENIDREGVSNYWFTPGYEREYHYDYR